MPYNHIVSLKADPTADSPGDTVLYEGDDNGVALESAVSARSKYIDNKGKYIVWRNNQSGHTKWAKIY